jgi:regulator of nucleoside diphosphate kinase
MSTRIHVSRSELNRLRALVERHARTGDGAAARRLAAELDRATVVDRPRQDVVAVGSRVRFETIRDRAVREVVVVHPSAADPGAGRVSVLAPVGAALLGLAPGDTIAWPLPGGREAQLRVLEVEPGSARPGTEPEAELAAEAAPARATHPSTH